MEHDKIRMSFYPNVFSSVSQQLLSLIFYNKCGWATDAVNSYPANLAFVLQRQISRPCAFSKFKVLKTHSMQRSVEWEKKKSQIQEFWIFLSISCGQYGTYSFLKPLPQEVWASWLLAQMRVSCFQFCFFSFFWTYHLILHFLKDNQWYCKWNIQQHTFTQNSSAGNTPTCPLLLPSEHNNYLIRRFHTCFLKCWQQL